MEGKIEKSFHKAGQKELRVVRENRKARGSLKVQRMKIRIIEWEGNGWRKLFKNNSTKVLSFHIV